MNSIKILGPAPIFLWPFNWGINWYHPNREQNKRLIQTFRFLNVFPIKTNQNWNWRVTSYRLAFSLIKPLWGNYIYKMIFYKILLNILTLNQRRPFLRKTMIWQTYDLTLTRQTLFTQELNFCTNLHTIFNFTIVVFNFLIHANNKLHYSRRRSGF
jgi:hypothetical protein